MECRKNKKTSSEMVCVLLIAVIITHFMFMYIVGYEEVFKIMQEGPAAHPVNFIVMIVFTGLFYFVFHGLESRSVP